MTKQDFYSEWLRLNKQFPHEFMKDNPSKLASIFERVKDLELAWLRSFVDRVIRTNNVKLNIIQAADGELKSRRESIRTNVMLADTTKTNYESLDKYLSDLGVTSLWDAVSSRRDDGII